MKLPTVGWRDRQRGAGLLCGCLFFVFWLLPARAAVDYSPRVITGVASTSDGKPVAHATLYFLGLPPDSYGMTNLGENTTVITDEQGRFTWNLTRDAAINANPKSDPPRCYVMPIDASQWKFRYAVNRGESSYRRTLAEEATRLCKTSWLQKGEAPRLGVEVPNLGTARLQIKAPDGRPLRESSVQLVVADRFSTYAGATIYEDKTDANGFLVWRGVAALYRLQIIAPGVGFGSTGAFEILPGREAAPVVPVLAPFARASGTVEAALLKKGAVVRSGDRWSNESWYAPQGEVDEKGRFVVEDLMPGEQSLQLVGGTKTSQISLTLQPGQTVGDLEIKVPRPEPKTTTTLDLFGNDPAEPAPEARGRVLNLDGTPVADAEVFAICSYDGVIRMYQGVLSAKTQSDGSYFIQSLPKSTIMGIKLVAVRNGSPLAFAAPKLERVSDKGKATAPRVYRADLVLPAGHPGLTVRVLHNGKPYAGAVVRLSSDVGAGLYGAGYVGSARGPERDKLAALLTPAAATNANGEAVFTDLTPGLWSATVLTGTNIKDAISYDGFYWGGLGPNKPFGSAQGIIVQNGPPRRFDMNIYAQHFQRAVRFLKPDGSPPALENINLSYSHAVDVSGTSTTLGLDQTGRGSISVYGPGLWRISGTFRDTPGSVSPDNAAPGYAGSAIMAFSPSINVPKDTAVNIRTLRREPGRIRVHLQDEKGRPVAGNVVIGDSFAPAKYATSTTQNGEALFTDMTAGSYSLRGSFTGQKQAPSLLNFPGDKALSGINLLVPQTATVKFNEETQVTLRPQPHGYVRGKLIVPDDLKNYAIYVPFHSEVGARVQLNQQTGEFIGGPFAPGKTTVLVQRITPNAAGRAGYRQYVPLAITGGRVTHIEVRVPEKAIQITAPPEEEETALLTMGGVLYGNRSGALKARVFLPDGTTPAWGAKASVFVPDTWEAVRAEQTDATGMLKGVASWRTNEKPQNPPPGSPKKPVLVAWLPGAHGATIVPLKANEANAEPKGETNGEIRIVLPPALAVRGRVSVGGQAVSDLKSSFRILAAYEGRGKLNGTLSVSAIAQADGSFELGGLTPGTYKIQAARDGIWLSETQTLNVGNAALPDLTFDIAPPGAAMLLHFVNAQNQPQANRAVRVLRPVGPLAQSLWPGEFRTDSNGDLRLEGLETGTHKLQPANARSTLSLTVPPLANNELPAKTFTIR